MGDQRGEEIARLSSANMKLHTRILELEAEVAEQARLNGMGGSRELKLMTRVKELEKQLASSLEIKKMLQASREDLQAYVSRLEAALKEIHDRPTDVKRAVAIAGKALRTPAECEAKPKAVTLWNNGKCQSCGYPWSEHFFGEGKVCVPKSSQSSSDNGEKKS